MTSAGRIDVAFTLAKEAFPPCFHQIKRDELNIDAPFLCVAGKYSYRCRDGLTSSLLFESIRQLSVARCVRVLPHVRRHDKVDFRTVAQLQVSCSALMSYETPVGAAPTFQGTIS